MELRDCKIGAFCWWAYSAEDKLLARLRYIGRDFVSIQIVAGTSAQVLRAGYGVGDAVNTSALSLHPVSEADKNA